MRDILNPNHRATMLFSRLSWYKPPKQACESVDSGENDIPRLPLEVWRRVIGFTIRMAGANAIELDDHFDPPYFNEEHPEVDPQLFQDRRALRQVCSAWRAVVIEISAEYLIIYSDKELKRTVKQLEAQKKKPGKPLGDWTTRLDFRIIGHYSIAHVIRLFQCTPNLLIYNNRNGAANAGEKFAPREILQALVTHCGKTIRRLEWSGAGEAPRYQDLAQLCNGLPNLTTLRLVAIFSFPFRRDGIPPIILLPKLKTLSLAVIPEPVEMRQTYALTWDPFLAYLSLNPAQLPHLERLDCDIFPLATMSFFHTHGPKIRQFRTTTWSADNVLPAALPLCTNLHTLVIAHGAESLQLPNFHPTIRRICIIPTVEGVIDVPQRVMNYAIMGPLDKLLESIAEMTAPCLSELRIRNIGAFSNVLEYSTWIQYWWRRWNYRGINFQDKAGVSFNEVKDPREALLDSIRG